MRAGLSISFQAHWLYEPPFCTVTFEQKHRDMDEHIGAGTAQEKMSCHTGMTTLWGKQLTRKMISVIEAGERQRERAWQR